MTTGVDESTFDTMNLDGNLSKYNWPEIKKYYMEHPKLTIKDVATHYNVSVKLAGRHAAKGKWRLIRKGEIINEKNNITSPRKAKDQTPEEVNDRHLDMAIQMQNMVKLHMALVSEYSANQYAEAKKNGVRVDKKEMYNSQGVKFLTEALQSSINIERVVRGMQTTGTSKSEKKVSITADLKKYDIKQIDAVLRLGGNLAKESDGRPTPSSFIEND